MVTFKRCGHEYIAHCPNVALSGEEGATCSEHTIPGELDALRARLSAAERERDDSRVLAMAMARWIEAHPPSQPDHACSRCVPGEAGVISGFVCGRHIAEGLLAAKRDGVVPEETASAYVERERAAEQAAFARGVEAAALEVERAAVAIPDNGPTWEKVTLVAPATDAEKETT